MVIVSVYIIVRPLQGSAFIKSRPSSYEITMRQDLLCLMLAYPGHISNVMKSGKQVYLVMNSGNKILYDDKKIKSIENKLAYPDLQDMLEQVYPITPVKVLLSEDCNPGRIRVYGLLNEVYGGSREQVESNLVKVKAGDNTFRFNRNNQAAEALGEVMQELIPLAEKRQDIRDCVYPSSGTYNYRVIAGTNRLSPHSYGIAIELARDGRDYWQWASREEAQERISDYPSEIVELFEKNNFIWGGKWGRFDIFHYEYRPEIIIKGRYFGDTKNLHKAWYEGVPMEDAYVRNCIEKIDEAIGKI